ncbi:hypothetical protein [Modestobacter sp. SYSU DS0511]
MADLDRSVVTDVPGGRHRPPRPEVQLRHEAPGLRTKDEQDFDACLPLLEGADQAWLADALRLARPGRPWLDRL